MDTTKPIPLPRKKNLRSSEETEDSLEGNKIFHKRPGEVGNPDEDYDTKGKKKVLQKSSSQKKFRIVLEELGVLLKDLDTEKNNGNNNPIGTQDGDNKIADKTPNISNSNKEVDLRCAGIESDLDNLEFINRRRFGVTKMLRRVDDCCQGTNSNKEENIYSSVHVENVYGAIQNDDSFSDDSNSENANSIEPKEMIHFRKPLKYLQYNPDNSSDEEDDDDAPDLHMKSKKINVSFNESKIKDFINDLITTENVYVNILRQVVEHYQPYLYEYVPQTLKYKVSGIFGNSSEIYASAQKFLNLLQLHKDNIEDVINVFIDSAEIFELYVKYCKNNLKSNRYSSELSDIIRRKELELNDRLGLVNHLSKPPLRLTQYAVILENIQKEEEQSKRSVDRIKLAINIISSVLRRSNDIMAIESIEKCEIDLSRQGSFIMRTSFNILHPRKFQSMVFLFEEIIVFTEKSSEEMDGLRYVDSIEMTNLYFKDSLNEKGVFFLIDYFRLKSVNEVTATYILETDKDKVRNIWVDKIKEILWAQLEAAKEDQKKNSTIKVKRLPTRRLSPPTTRRIITKDKATFYINMQ